MHCRLILSCPGACWFTRGRGLSFTSGRVLVRAHVDGPGSQPIDTENHTSCVSRLVLFTTACVSSLADWAVSIGSHMQDMGISEAPPRLAAPSPLFDADHVKKPRSINSELISAETLSFVSVATRFPPRWAPLAPEGNRCVAHSLRSIWPKLSPAWIGHLESFVVN